MSWFGSFRSRLERTTMCRQFRSCRLYSCRRLTCTSKSASGSSPGPPCASREAESRTLFARLTEAKRARKAESSAKGSSFRSSDRSATQPAPQRKAPRSALSTLPRQPPRLPPRSETEGRGWPPSRTRTPVTTSNTMALEAALPAPLSEATCAHRHPLIRARGKEFGRGVVVARDRRRAGSKKRARPCGVPPR